MGKTNQTIRTLRVAASNVRSKLAESLYLKTGWDLTRPVQIYGLPTLRCNARCVMCDFWSRGDHTELPADVWNRALGSLRRFVGPYHIQFSAAEPLVKKDFFDILAFCGANGISAGITTNGLLLTDTNARRLLDCGVFNVNISVDSLDPVIHNRIRGVPGMLDKVRTNIENLVAVRDASRAPLRIILRPLVCADTLDGLEDLVEYATDQHLTAVNAQPVVGTTDDILKMLDVDHDHLVAVVDRLVEMKRDGYPIMNSEPAIRRWVDYFGDPASAKVVAGESRCVVALRNLTILTNGDVVTCGDRHSTIGNIATDDIATMWRSDRAKELRKSLTRCQKLCTGTCVEKRRWRDYLSLMRKLAG